MTIAYHIPEQRPYTSGDVDVSNVFEYFRAKLGVPPSEESLKELPVTSNCGIDCIRVIDKAAEYLTIADSHPDVVRPLIKSANAAVETFWLG